MATHNKVYFTEEQKQRIIQLYVDEKCSMSEIARRFEIRNVTLKKNLIDWGVKLRTLKEAQLLKREQVSINFGKRKNS